MRQCAFLIAGILGCLPAAGLAEEPADYFKGKTVSYIVATAPGGGYDTYGRLVAEFMQKHLPGSTFVVRNVVGAGTVIGTNMIYAAKPDGLTIGTFNTGLIYSQIVQNEGVRFDLTKMSWIGKAASDGRAILVSTTSPVKRFEDLLSLKQPVNFSTGGTSGATYIETKMLRDSLNLQIKILTGYDGNDDQMAMRRGEIVGALGSRSSYDDFVRNGYGQFLAQIGGKSTDVRQLSTMVTEPLAKAVVALIQSQGDLARVTAGPPGIKPDVLATLRTAYRAALEDKDFLARAARSNLPIEPAYGDDVAKSVASALAQPPETVKMLKDILQAEKN
jgi:tripartite-type tricarboxylate transporter receptor subunit TctC